MTTFASKFEKKNEKTLYISGLLLFIDAGRRCFCPRFQTFQTAFTT